jgi:hypothetical protein
MQFTMFDPRETPTATAAMLNDEGLKAAIQAVRVRSLTQRTDLGEHTVLRMELEKREPGGILPWPYVEHLCEVGDRSAWAVEDRGERYVVVGPTVFVAGDMALTDARIQAAAKAAFARLDAGMSPEPAIGR